MLTSRATRRNVPARWPAGYSARPMDRGHTTLSLQRYLTELGELDGKVPSELVVRALLARSANRLHVICESVLRRQYPRLTRGPANLDAEDVLGGVVERLLKAMRNVRPDNVRQFFALANQHLRWELNDLARRLDARRETVGLPPAEPTAPEPAGGDPAATPTACRILEAISRLPEREAEAFHLVRIQGISWREAAQITATSETTVKRRVARSVVLLAEMLPDLRPD